MRKCVFSIDVEDWFHIMELPSAPKIGEWNSMPSFVEKNFIALLDTLGDVKATCFFLGWVAERQPHLVREAIARGHEIASHGYAHDLIYEQTRVQFHDDVRKARLLIEDIAGVPVKGYRAPGFSVNEQTPWFFQELQRAGYSYSSSVFPATRQHGGGLESHERHPHFMGRVLEFPISVSDILGKRLCFFGGGYLRLSPYTIIRHEARRLLNDGLPVVYYLHPREIDPDHPRLPMSASRAFKSYIGLKSVESKVRSLCRDFSFLTFAELYDQLCKSPDSLMDMLGTLTPSTEPAEELVALS